MANYKRIWNQLSDETCEQTESPVKNPIKNVAKKVKELVQKVGKVNKNSLLDFILKYKEIVDNNTFEKALGSFFLQDERIMDFNNYIKKSKPKFSVKVEKDVTCGIRREINLIVKDGSNSFNAKIVCMQGHPRLKQIEAE